MPRAIEFIIWLAAGFAVARLHLYLLQRAIPQQPTRDALRRVLDGFPLRILLQLPLLYLAARSGLLACGGLIIGSLIGRWLACWHALRPMDPARVQE